jgi:YegS/Rv2252/BmrU family lipid kinase
MSKIVSVALLTNTLSGKHKGVETALWLNQQLALKNIESTIYSDNWPSEAILNTYSDCWIIGGDGTINYFINQYPNCSIPIVLFNGGTGNDFAWKLYGGISNEELFNSVFDRPIQSIDAGKVNDKLYINCLGIGFDGEIVASMKTIRFIGGHFGYMLAVIYKILFFKESFLKIQTEQQNIEGYFLLALFVNSSRAGGGFYIAPTASINDGYLDMVLADKMPIWKRLWYLPIIKSGKHLHYPFVHHQLGKEFTIETDKLMPIQVDGELLYLKKLHIEVLHKQFLFRI